jgi:hypothetical protein
LLLPLLPSLSLALLLCRMHTLSLACWRPRSLATSAAAVSAVVVAAAAIVAIAVGAVVGAVVCAGAVVVSVSLLIPPPPPWLLLLLLALLLAWLPPSLSFPPSLMLLLPLHVHVYAHSLTGLVGVYLPRAWLLSLEPHCKSTISYMYYNGVLTLYKTCKTGERLEYLLCMALRWWCKRGSKDVTCGSPYLVVPCALP